MMRLESLFQRSDAVIAKVVQEETVTGNNVAHESKCKKLSA